MSTGVEVPALLCQGFLKKRKDKMKLRWVTYWFRLHNTTLFFYTKKHGSALDLRGQYYIYEVQSVREVSRPENKCYLFEITMKNGKKKMLAADTADVRQEWMNQLWKAMLLNGPPDRTGPVTDGETVSGKKPEARSSLCESSYTETTSTAMNSRYLSFDQESFQSFVDSDTQESLQADNEMEQSTEEILLTDFDYDILPPPKPTEETIYDTHPSNWPSNEGKHVVTDSIYDVPNSIIRKMTDHTIEFHSSTGRAESGGLLSDMIACLGSESAAWVKTAPL
ncbi:uncharacterized protein LOC127451107 isoform X2 [Myxocyprinus asiaticus]|uniref:uncharacterized protein LOC127451107 isoform X2 n=1 Tax=Myxocyprinus asiaticus TaxID=70543 RepID=UPI0022223278|nr:uncharacterized protein LOC127451107 isoform X2 [Myxocyprinus asiaticus]